MKTIVAIDGSKQSQWALDWITPFHSGQQPTVLAIHALDLTPLRLPFGVAAELESSIRDQAYVLEQRAATLVTETKSWLAKSHVKGTVLVKTGKPARILLSYAQRQNLIILGNRGFNSLERLLIGSVSQTVAMNAPCPVLVVKQPPVPFAASCSRWTDRGGPRRPCSGSLRDIGLVTAGSSSAILCRFDQALT
jgi:nucleotide-binding universal stress UspA family protein